jgi:hypothetical protein
LCSTSSSTATRAYGRARVLLASLTFASRKHRQLAFERLLQQAVPLTLSQYGACRSCKCRDRD